MTRSGETDFQDSTFIEDRAATERDFAKLSAELERSQKAERHYRELFENSPIGIYRTTPDGRVLLANASLLEMMGFSCFEELATRNLEQEGFKNIQYRQNFKEAMERSGEVKGFESPWVRKDGKVIHIREHALATRDEQGRILHYDGTVENVSERVRMESELGRSLVQLGQLVDEVVEALATAVEKRDPYTAGHQKRVAMLAAKIATGMGKGKSSIRAVELAAMMHDIGKISIPAEILVRPGKLSAEEMALVKLHSAAGYDIVRNIPFDMPIAKIVAQHHEKLDGSGYPLGLRGDDILKEAQIITVADIMEALSSHRPYRPAYGKDVALTLLSRLKGTKLDAEAVEVCVELFVEQRFLFTQVPSAPTPIDLE
ncbi:MAG: HD domain-containing protein [Myxococcota bacterium]|jgi:PAS domain S-box-containing protein/putative nucleotidyltransferase with HDIG domain|nr:HD domain-containing protein [Myxococcota bacterium]